MSSMLTSAPPLATPARAGTSRLDRLKALPRKPGEASFFFYDAHFRNEAVKVLPGEFFVHDEDILVMTTLGPRQAHRRHEPLPVARRCRCR
jgi:chemotaxis protein CheD